MTHKTDTPPDAAADAPIVDVIVDHVLGARYEDLSDHDLHRARTYLLDTLGVAIAGSRGAAIDALIDTARGWGDGDEATVWVTGERLPATQAAVVNAYQIHCLEYDCVHEAAVVHPMATVLSALMAFCERRAGRGAPVSGRDFLLAMCIGIDVATLMGVAAHGPIRWFRPATAGGFGAVAAMARLEGLDKTGVKDAFGAMYGQTSGTLQPHVEGSPVLGLQVGFNARAAICAIDLARAGFRGPHDVFDGPYGYFRLLEDGAFDLAPIRETLGREWQVSRLSHKPFPSGRLTHGVVDALMRLTAAHGFAPEDVAAVRGTAPPLVTRLVGRPDIPDPEPNYAKLCLRFVAGAWLARGKVDVPEFSDPEVLSDPRIHDFAARVEVETDDNPSQSALAPQWWQVTLTDGTVHEIDLPHVYGHPMAALTDDENLAKFRRCVGWGRAPMAGDAADALIAAVAGAETLDDAGALARMTVIPGARD